MIMKWSIGTGPGLSLDKVQLPGFDGPLKAMQGASPSFSLTVKHNHLNRWNVLLNGGVKNSIETFRLNYNTTNSKDLSYINFNWQGFFASAMAGITLYRHHKSAEYNIDIRGGVTVQQLSSNLQSNRSSGTAGSLLSLQDIAPLVKTSTFTDLKLGMNVNAILSGVGLIDYGALLYYGVNKYDKYQIMPGMIQDVDEQLPVRKFGLEFYVTYYFISWNQYGQKEKPSTY